MKNPSGKSTLVTLVSIVAFWSVPISADINMLGECSYDRGHFARTFVLMRDGRSGRLDPNDQFNVATNKRRELLALNAWTSLELYDFVNAEAQRLLSTLRITGGISDQGQVSSAVQKHEDEMVEIAGQLGCAIFSQ